MHEVLMGLLRVEGIRIIEWVASKLLSRRMVEVQEIILTRHMYHSLILERFLPCLLGLLILYLLWGCKRSILRWSLLFFSHVK